MPKNRRADIYIRFIKSSDRTAAKVPESVFDGN